MFQLQFQATQVPKMKGKGLMISLIPAEIGKPIARLERVPIVDGTCKWEEPIYEMVKLVKHQKTETYKEKIYYFNVQTGSTKSGFVGEVGVDFANFAETTEPFQLALPLTASDTGAILHVFIQKMQRADEPREAEEDESIHTESVRSKNQASDRSENGNSKKGDEIQREKHVKQRSSTDWSLGSLSDRSMADLLNSPEHNYNNQTNGYTTEASKNAVEVLKSHVSRLERQAELSELELESLRKQMLKENKRGQDLCGRIDELREEKEALERECDRKMEEKNKEISYLSEKIRESEMEKEAIESVYAELEVERKEKEELKIHIDDISLDYKMLLQENDDISSKLEETQVQQMKMQSEYSKSLSTTVKEYELQMKRLEEKIMNQAMELSKSLDTIGELETHIKSLEKELEKQGQDFEDDVQDLMKAKIEQEERVVQAEEALRKSKLTNATAVENLQEALEKSQQELLSLKDTHKLQVEKLCEQIDQQAEQIKKMSLELEACNDSKEHGENKSDLQEWIREKETMVTEFNSLKKETENLQKESTSLVSEKNVMIRTLKSELKRLRGDYNELQQRFSVMESQKDDLQKEVSKLEQNHLNLLKERKVACDVTSNNHYESRSTLESAKRNEGRCSGKEPSMPTSHYNDEQKLNKLLGEISSLDERNKHMETELKEMQEKYSDVSLRFAEVEGERQQLVMALRNMRNGKKI